jgi:hypothetical protein
MSWQFARDGADVPGTPNSQVQFAVDPGDGTETITPANFALMGSGSPVDWNAVEMGSADLNLYLGDFNGDALVDHCDLALWLPQEGSAPGDPGYDPQFDLNADARVDQLDLELLLAQMYEPVMPPAPVQAGDPVAGDLAVLEDLVAEQAADESVQNDEIQALDEVFGSELSSLTA